LKAKARSPQREVADLSFRLALYERDPTKAARALANMPREGKIDLIGSVPFPHTWYEGLLAKLRQDIAAARSAFTAARAETEKLVHAQPENVTPLAVLALIDAGVRRQREAIREGRTACDILPAYKGCSRRRLANGQSRPHLCGSTGEKDVALEQLEVVNKLVSGPSYGELHLNPDWDPLRGDPRFREAR